MTRLLLIRIVFVGALFLLGRLLSVGPLAGSWLAVGVGLVLGLVLLVAWDGIEQRRRART